MPDTANHKAVIRNDKVDREQSASGRCHWPRIRVRISDHRAAHTKEMSETTLALFPMF